ncbi:MAG: hypothetical protein WCL14_01210 [Bacteroidota bacterium]
MKKALLLFMIIPFFSFGQEWSAGLKIIPQENINIGSNVATSNSKYISSISTSFGLNYKFCYNLRSYYSHNKNSFSIEALYMNSHLFYTRKDVELPTTDFSFKSIEIPLIFQSRNDDWGFYGEAGLGYFCILSKDVSPSNSIQLAFNNSNIDGIIGIGLDNKLNKGIILTIGLRGYYPLFDMTSNLYHDKNYQSTHIVRFGSVLAVMYYFDYFNSNMHHSRHH